MRKSTIFSRAKEDAAPVKAFDPEAVEPIATSAEECIAPSYHFDPIGTGAVTGPPDGPTQLDPVDAAASPTVSGSFTTPILQRRAHLNRQVDLNKRPKGKRSKLREMLEELAEEDEGEDESTEGRPAKVLQTKRLSRTGATPEGNPLAFRRRPDQPPETMGPATDGTIYTPPKPARNSKLSLLLAWTCFLLLGMVVFLWLGRPRDGGSVLPGERQVIPDPRVVTPDDVGDHALELANNALISARSGDIKKSDDLYQQIRREKLVLPGLKYRDVVLALEAHNYDAVLASVDRCIAANENVPQCLYVRANVAVFGGDFAGAVNDFDAAIRLTSFSPRYYFFCAECLRRRGSVKDALMRFEQALMRNPNPAETALIVFRMNLAKIEGDVDTELQKQLADLLAAPNPSCDTLLLAAASEMSRSNYSAAAEHLRQCTQTAPQPFVESRLNDYFFKFHLQQPQILAVLGRPATTTPRMMGSFAAAVSNKPPLQNLADRSLSEADPAGWP